MRLMGIDYGSKRIGISLSDESGSMAFPHGVIPNDGKAHKAIVTIIEEKRVGTIIIGHSLDKEGQANKIHKAVEELITDLTLETGLPIHLEPEQFSTQQAIRIQGRTSQTDAAAAALILDSFIQRNK